MSLRDGRRVGGERADAVANQSTATRALAFEALGQEVRLVPERRRQEIVGGDPPDRRGEGQHEMREERQSDRSVA